LHKEALKLVFSNPAYLILSGLIFVGMLFLLLHTRELLFFEPYFVFYLGQGDYLSFALIIIVSGLMGLVLSMAVYRIQTLRASAKKMGSGLLGSIIGAGAGVCTSCGPIGFAVISAFGASAAITFSFLTIYEIPIRIAAIAILSGTYFLMVKGIIYECKINPNNTMPSMSQIKCADCGCLPDECKNSKSSKECPNCSSEECCCWVSIQKK